jgi:hypothetical protein
MSKEWSLYIFWLCGRLQGNREYSLMELKVTGSSDPSELDPCSISLQRERQHSMGEASEPKQPR